MPEYLITFRHKMRGDGLYPEEEVCDKLLNYLQECVADGDVTPFNLTRLAVPSESISRSRIESHKTKRQKGEKR